MSRTTAKRPMVAVDPDKKARAVATGAFSVVEDAVDGFAVPPVELHGKALLINKHRLADRVRVGQVVRGFQFQRVHKFLFPG
jgi:hypothetical protein